MIIIMRHLATKFWRNLMRNSVYRKPCWFDLSVEMISLPGPSTLGTLIGNLNGDPFHVKTSFLDVPGDTIALLTTMSFH